MNVLLTHTKLTVALPVLRFMKNVGLRSIAPERSFLRKLLDIQVLPDLKHASLHPIATYAPFENDQAFLADFAKVRKNTLVDVYRLYELWSLILQVSKLPKGDILEVGVWRGGSGALMALRAKALGMDSDFFLADTFQGVVKAGTRDTNYVGGEHADVSYDAVKDFCQGLGLDRVHLRRGIFPDDTGAELESRSFRLCHIDVDTYDSAKDVFDWVWPRLVPGGAVVFDDYGFYNCSGVTRLVNELAKRDDTCFLYNLNGHGIILKLA